MQQHRRRRQSFQRFRSVGGDALFLQNPIREQEGTNPEELIAAAHAGCFTMALAFGMQMAGLNPTELATEAAVTLEPEGQGFKISKSALTLGAKVPNLDEAKFMELAKGAEELPGLQGLERRDNAGRQARVKRESERLRLPTLDAQLRAEEDDQCLRRIRPTLSPSTRGLFLKATLKTHSEIYAGNSYRQHNPLIEDGMEGVRKFVAWIVASHPDARGEIKRVFADGDYVVLHSHWHGLSDNPRGEAVVDISG